jgi:dephospho-CoA kinase
MIVMGLTGSLAMGKSTLAAMLAADGIPVHDADQAVHALLAPGRAGYLAVAAAFPFFAEPDLYGRKDAHGRRPLDRAALGHKVFHDPAARKKLENLLHPLVQQGQAEFLRKARLKGLRLAVLDIPLLFETGAESRVDYTICASAPYAVQRARALQRPGMNEEKFNAIISAQMPDGEKRRRADFVVHTGLGHAYARRQLSGILNTVFAAARPSKNLDMRVTARRTVPLRINLQKIR